MAVNPSRVQLEQMKRILASMDIAVAAEEIRERELALNIIIRKDSVNGRLFAQAPSQFEQTIGALGWRVVETVVEMEQFNLVITKPRTDL